MQDYWFGFVRSFDEIEDAPQKHGKFWAFIYATVGAVCAAVVIVFLIFTFCFRGVGVLGESMEPTLHNGDLLAVASLPEAQKGDIVIITQTDSLEKPIVKRVIASGGDVVDIDFMTGVVKVNDNILDESAYIAEPTTTAGDVQFPLTVPQGCFFVLGDNRNNSMDSRFSVIDCVDENYVLGVVKFRAYPFSAVQIF